MAQNHCRSLTSQSDSSGNLNTKSRRPAEFFNIVFATYAEDRPQRELFESLQLPLSFIDAVCSQPPTLTLRYGLLTGRGAAQKALLVAINNETTGQTNDEDKTRLVDASDDNLNTFLTSVEGDETVEAISTDGSIIDHEPATNAIMADLPSQKGIPKFSSTQIAMAASNVPERWTKKSKGDTKSSLMLPSGHRHRIPPPPNVGMITLLSDTLSSDVILGPKNSQMWKQLSSRRNAMNSFSSISEADKTLKAVQSIQKFAKLSQLKLQGDKEALDRTFSGIIQKTARADLPALLQPGAMQSPPDCGWDSEIKRVIQSNRDQQEYTVRKRNPPSVQTDTSTSTTQHKRNLLPTMHSPITNSDHVQSIKTPRYRKKSQNTMQINHTAPVISPLKQLLSPRSFGSTLDESFKMKQQSPIQSRNGVTPQPPQSPKRFQMSARAVARSAGIRLTTSSTQSNIENLRNSSGRNTSTTMNSRCTTRSTDRSTPNTRQRGSIGASHIQQNAAAQRAAQVENAVRMRLLQAYEEMWSDETSQDPHINPRNHGSSHASLSSLTQSNSTSNLGSFGLNLTNEGSPPNQEDIGFEEATEWRKAKQLARARKSPWIQSALHLRVKSYAQVEKQQRQRKLGDSGIISINRSNAGESTMHAKNQKRLVWLAHEKDRQARAKETIKTAQQIRMESKVDLVQHNVSSTQNRERRERQCAWLTCLALRKSLLQLLIPICARRWHHWEHAAAVCIQRAWRRAYSRAQSRLRLRSVMRLWHWLGRVRIRMRLMRKQRSIDLIKRFMNEFAMSVSKTTVQAHMKRFRRRMIFIQKLWRQHQIFREARISGLEIIWRQHALALEDLCDLSSGNIPLGIASTNLSSLRSNSPNARTTPNTTPSPIARLRITPPEQLVKLTFEQALERLQNLFPNAVKALEALSRRCRGQQIRPQALFCMVSQCVPVPNQLSMEILQALHVIRQSVSISPTTRRSALGLVIDSQIRSVIRQRASAKRRTSQLIALQQRRHARKLTMTEPAAIMNEISSAKIRPTSRSSMRIPSGHLRIRSPNVREEAVQDTELTLFTTMQSSDRMQRCIAQVYIALALASPYNLML